MSDTSNAEKVTLVPLNNILNYYDQPSYYLKFSMVDDVSGTNSVVICETGTAPLSIQSLTIESSVGPTEEAKNTVATSLIMTITEPMGTNLIDTMVTAAQTLNIKNYTTCPYILEIYFHGYDPTTGSQISKIDNTSYKYFLRLNEIQSSLNAGNVTHSVNMIPYDQIALFDCYAVLQDAISIPVTSNETLGDYISDLKSKLNGNWLSIYGQQNVTYNFAYENYDSTMGLPAGITSPKDLPININKSTTSPSMQGDITHFSDKTSILTILDTILARSDQAVALLAPNASSSENSIQPNSVVGIKSISHRVTPSVKITGFDSKSNDYIREITYTICPYQSYRLKDSVVAWQQAFDTEHNISKTKDMVLQKLLRKNYDYVFTGTNTEVLNLDLTFNFNWAFVMDVQGGLVNSYSNIIGKQYETEQATPTVLDFTTDWNSNSTTSIVSSSNTLNSPIGNTSISNTFTDTMLDNNISNATTTSSTTQENVQNSSGYIPITIQSMTRRHYNATQYGIQGDNTGRQSLYGMLLDQLYISNSQTKLLEINMEIKGDPFWLGTTSDSSGSTLIQSSTSTNMVSSTNAVATNNVDYANYSTGEQCFCLNFVLPDGYNSTTGEVNLSQANIYAGIYSVKQVTSTFANGSFTQILNANKIDGIVNSDTIIIQRS